MLHSSSELKLTPLVLADRLITLAQDAERAGYRGAASGLVKLMNSMLDSSAPRRRPPSARTRAGRGPLRN